jgi:hypothetical protein
MTTPARPRPGYTLLEVLLAAGIATLLMAALYVGMDVQLRYAQEGREAVDEATLSRAILARITADLTNCLTPVTATPSSSSGGGGSTAAASTSATSTTGTGTTGTSSGTATGGATTSLNAVTPFNGGVQGDNGQVTVWVSRVPPPPDGVAPNDPDAPMQPLGASDIRRVSYWIASGGGLARQELLRVSASDDDAQMPPYVPNEDQLVFAPEVASLLFRYFDGTNWQDTWDGTQLGADGATPIGPPRAIEVTVGIRKPGADPNDASAVQTFRHVVAIAAANAQPAAAADTTGTGTTTSGTDTGTTP